VIVNVNVNIAVSFKHTAKLRIVQIALRKINSAVPGTQSCRQSLTAPRSQNIASHAVCSEIAADGR